MDMALTQQGKNLGLDLGWVGLNKNINFLCQIYPLPKCMVRRFKCLVPSHTDNKMYASLACKKMLAVGKSGKRDLFLPILPFITFHKSPSPMLGWVPDLNPC